MARLGREAVCRPHAACFDRAFSTVCSAAERYLDITPAERARRRERGWGDEIVRYSVAKQYR